jgi:hypothetical protein
MLDAVQDFAREGQPRRPFSDRAHSSPGIAELSAWHQSPRSLGSDARASANDRWYLGELIDVAAVILFQRRIQRVVVHQPGASATILRGGNFLPELPFTSLETLHRAFTS